MVIFQIRNNIASFIMSLNNLEYNLLKLQHQHSQNVPVKEVADLVPVSRLVTVLVLTVLITVAELVLAQLTHCISLLVLVHQNIYNTLTLIVSCVTRWKGEEVSSEIFLYNQFLKYFLEKI